VGHQDCRAKRGQFDCDLCGRFGGDKNTFRRVNLTDQEAHCIGAETNCRERVLKVCNAADFYFDHGYEFTDSAT
jgi:hypothetical protein